MDGNKFIDGIKTAGEATGLTLLNVYVWFADILGMLHQITALVLSLLSIYVMWLRIKEQKAKKKGDKNNGDDIFIG